MGIQSVMCPPPAHHTGDPWESLRILVCSANVAEPSKASLAKNGEHAVHASAFQDLCVGYFVLPLNVQIMPQAPQVEAVEFLLLTGGPCLRTWCG